MQATKTTQSVPAKMSDCRFLTNDSIILALAYFPYYKDY